MQFAALRELFKAKAGNHSSEFSSGELTRDIEFPYSEKNDIKTEVQCPVENRKIEEVVSIEDQMEIPPSGRPSLMGLNDAADEFFDVSEPAEYDHLENEWPCSFSEEEHSPVITSHHD